jgi:hypothetical protein
LNYLSIFIRFLRSMYFIYYILYMSYTCHSLHSVICIFSSWYSQFHNFLLYHDILLIYCTTLLLNNNFILGYRPYLIILFDCRHHFFFSSQIFTLIYFSLTKYDIRLYHKNHMVFIVTVLFIVSFYSLLTQATQ